MLREPKKTTNAAKMHKNWGRKSLFARRKSKGPRIFLRHAPTGRSDKEEQFHLSLWALLPSYHRKLAPKVLWLSDSGPRLSHTILREEVSWYLSERLRWHHSVIATFHPLGTIHFSARPTAWLLHFEHKSRHPAPKWAPGRRATCRLSPFPWPEHSWLGCPQIPLCQRRVSVEWLLQSLWYPGKWTWELPWLSNGWKT